MPASFWASLAALIVAGLTIAAQKVVTSVAGYLAIRRGRVLAIGDRITMGGVRGDVIALGFIQTTIIAGKRTYLILSKFVFLVDTRLLC